MAKLRGKMRLLSSIRIIRVTLALAVAFWMAGAGCLLGCENMVSAASAAHTLPTEDSAGTHAAAGIVVSGEACASMKSHDCCAKRGKQSVAKKTQRQSTVKLTANSARHSNVHAQANQAPVPVDPVATEAAAPISTMRDCPLAVNAAAALSKAKPDESGSAIVRARAANTFPSVQEQLAALAPPSALPNRGHTYLRCCAFLI
jgi:hypothetical protein